MLRHLTAACLAALLALNAASVRVAAKPPDLPDDDPIIVAVPAGPALGEAYLLATDPLLEIGCEAQPEPIAAVPKAEGVCPYRAPTGDRRPRTASGPKAMPSVLDNLRALEEAAAEIDRARDLAKEGKLAEAILRLDGARKRCPGSSCARRADEVMAEIVPVGYRRERSRTPSDASPCGCEALTRLRNAGACYAARLGTYCEKVQEAAKRKRDLESATYDYNGFGSLDGCESACPECRTVTITLGVNSDGGLTGSIISNERNCDCGKACPCDEACECESACPKCAKMHRAVMEKAKRVAGVKEQVDGLLKACYFAVREGRNAKAADLARQAHALDPKRVEADPLAYKLHVLAEEGQCEECETTHESSPACPKCPTDPAENSVSLRPALPAVDPEVVVALDRVMTKGADGDDKGEASGCPCREIAKAVGANLLGMLLCPSPKDCDRGFLVLGFDAHGINAYSVSKYAGMKVLVQYRDGLPLVWVAADRAAGE